MISAKADTLVNLYLGVRDSKGAWDIGSYAKNLFNNQTILSQLNDGITTRWQLFRWRMISGTWLLDSTGLSQRRLDAAS